MNATWTITANPKGGLFTSKYRYVIMRNGEIVGKSDFLWSARLALRWQIRKHRRNGIIETWKA